MTALPIPSWCPITERAVRSDRVLMPQPSLDQDMSLDQCVEYLAIQKLVAHRAIIALTVEVLLRGAGTDVERLRADLS